MTDENYWLKTNIETINTSIDELLDRVNELRIKKKELQEQLNSEQSAQGGFKVGDKVRYIIRHRDTESVETGTVFEICTSEVIGIRKQNNFFAYFPSKELTLVTTPTETLTPKFKLYDYVEYKKCKHQIIAVLPPHENDHLFGFKGGIVYKYHIGGSGGFVSEDALSPWEDETSTPKFKVGDFVKSDYNRKYEITKIVFPSDDDYAFLLRGEVGIAYNFRIVDTSVTGQVLERLLSPWEDEPTATKPKFDIDLDIKLDTGWFFISDVHKMLRKETSRQLGIPDSINSEYRTSEAPEKVNYCHVWFEMDNTVYNYYLNSKLSDDKFTVLSYLPERRLTDE